MKYSLSTNKCERNEQLIAVLYGEADKQETAQFDSHLRECASCKEEFLSLAGLRNSVRDWRDEALLAFTPAGETPKRKSAIAALKAFLDFSPAWMKLATAFAVVVFCLLGFVAFVKTRPVELTLNSPQNPEKMYTESELKQAIAKAVEESVAANRQPYPIERPVQNQVPRQVRMDKQPLQAATSGRPLSRRERQQLAADLRLATRTDDDSLELLSDRINQ
jgi:hypothetical protein